MIRQTIIIIIIMLYHYYYFYYYCYVRSHENCCPPHHTVWYHPSHHHLQQTHNRRNRFLLDNAPSPPVSWRRARAINSRDRNLLGSRHVCLLAADTQLLSLLLLCQTFFRSIRHYKLKNISANVMLCVQRYYAPYSIVDNSGSWNYRKVRAIVFGLEKKPFVDAGYSLETIVSFSR